MQIKLKYLLNIAPLAEYFWGRGNHQISPHILYILKSVHVSVSSIHIQQPHGNATQHQKKWIKRKIAAELIHGTASFLFSRPLPLPMSLLQRNSLSPGIYTPQSARVVWKHPVWMGIYTRVAWKIAQQGRTAAIYTVHGACTAPPTACQAGKAAGRPVKGLHFELTPTHPAHKGCWRAFSTAHFAFDVNVMEPGERKNFLSTNFRNWAWGTLWEFEFIAICECHPW